MKIKIYSTPTCPYCSMAKDFLSEKGIEFEDIDVSVDQKAAEEMIEKSGQMGVPVIVIIKDNGEESVILGFDREKLVSELGLS